MRWILSLMMVCGALTLMGESCDGDPNGDGGSGGDPGTGGEPGTGGDAGMGGTAGTGGNGGSSASNDCGYMTTCNPEGVDPTCEDYCDGLCDGGPDDVYADSCRDDSRCWCWCATGVCSQDDCVESPDCRFDDPDESFCETTCAQICAGQDDIREAYCDGPGDVIGFCRCICKVGGNVSCVDDF
jgi:hypothetical protein